MSRLLAVLVAVVGLAFTAGSMGLPWVAVPVDFNGKTVQAVEPWATPVAKIAALLVILVILWDWWRGRRSIWVSPTAAGLWFAFVLVYPYLVMAWDRPTAGAAAWAEAQHRNIIWSGGDVNVGIEYRLLGALDRIFVADTPMEVTPMGVSDWQFAQGGLGRLPEMATWLGYSNTFFDFLRKGWVCGLMGAVFLSLWSTLYKGTMQLDRASVALAALLGTTVVWIMCAWSWALFAASKLGVAAQLAGEGRYAESLEMLQQAGRMLPTLQENTYYVGQTGVLEKALGRDTPAARLWDGVVLERSGRIYQADMLFHRLIDELPASSPIRREACRAGLRFAIDDLNSGKVEEASRRLERLLAADPCNLKANYTLQLAYLRTGRYRDLMQLVNRMDLVYDYYQIPNKYAVQYAAHSHAVVAAYAMGDLDAAVVESRKVLSMI